MCNTYNITVLVDLKIQYAIFTKGASKLPRRTYVIITKYHNSPQVYYYWYRKHWSVIVFIYQCIYMEFINHFRIALNYLKCVPVKNKYIKSISIIVIIEIIIFFIFSIICFKSIKYLRGCCSL